jgi:hypothetical protein
LRSRTGSRHFDVDDFAKSSGLARRSEQNCEHVCWTGARNGFGEPRDREPKLGLSRPRPAAETAHPVREPAETPAKCALFVRDQETPAPTTWRSTGTGRERLLLLSHAAWFGGRVSGARESDPMQVKDFPIWLRSLLVVTLLLFGMNALVFFVSVVAIVALLETTPVVIGAVGLGVGAALMYVVIKLLDWGRRQNETVTEEATREALEDILHYRRQLSDLRRTPEFAQMRPKYQFALESIEGSINVTLKVFAGSHKHIGEQIRKVSSRLRGKA